MTLHRCLFTGDAMGSGDIVLLICPEKEALSLVARYRQALEEFLAYMPRLRQYAWLGGHSIQENGCRSPPVSRISPPGDVPGASTPCGSKVVRKI